MTKRQSKAWLWALVGFMFLSQTGLNLVRPLTSYKLIALDAPPAVIGLVTSAYAIVPVFAAIALGRLAQRVRRLRILVAGGGLLIAVGAAVLALAGGTWPIVVASVMYGMGHLASQIGSQSAVARYAKDSELDQGFGWTTAGLSAGQLVGPLIGGWILGLHAAPSQAQRLHDVATASWIGVACAVASIPLMLLPVVLPGRSGGSRPVTSDGPSGQGASAGVRGNDPDAPPRATTLRVLRRPGVASHILASLAMLSIMDILTSFLPLVGERAGVSPMWIGVLLAVRSLSSIVSRTMISALSRRWNRSQLVIVSLVMGSLTVAAVPPVIDVIPLSLVLLLVGGFFIGLAQPLTMTMIITSVPETWRSPALAVRLTGNRVGQVIIPLVAGAVVAPVGPAGAIWLTCVLLLGSAGEKLMRYGRSGAGPVGR
ncbi:MFS transporter [Kocuria massiliensis]|uniref:MFS transporter n=1 Tax=Kocuria massiliensis TaxID=1926282 RepID=UPI0022B9CC87|nr:MFS transporter [Kocuria massiliensis]